MRYLIGHTPYEYEVVGIRVPGRSEARDERGVVAITEAQEKILLQNKSFKSLLDTKAVKILDTKPSWAVSANEQLQTKDAKIAELQKALESNKDVAAKDARIAELEKALADAKKPAAAGEQK